MTFYWPNLLWLLAFVPVLIALYIFILKRRRANAIRYAHLGLIKQAMESGPGFRRHIPPLLLLVAIAAMIVAVARPALYITLPSQRGTIVLALDISGSMRADDVAPDRLTASLEAARTFVEKQPDDVRIGVVAFAGTANVIQLPTTDREQVLGSITRVRAQRGTAIGTGLLTSLMAIFDELEFDVTPFDRPFNGTFGLTERTPIQPQNRAEPREPGDLESAVIVLLTDGQATTGPHPLDAAEQAAALGVRVYTVGLGTPEGVVLRFGSRSMRVRLDEETLRQIAYVTDGEYYRAGSGEELEQIYSSLSTQLIVERERTEVTSLFTAFATILVVISALLSLLWFRRLT